MNIEEEINQIRHDDYVRFWANKAESLSIYNEAMKLELAKPEPDNQEANGYIMATDQILSFGGTIPEELGWKQFADLMPNLAKEVKENYDNLKSKLCAQVQAYWAERQARRAKLPWYKRWFA